MTRQEYKEKLNKILESMIGEEIVHVSFGLGTIMGFEDNRCIVKYDRFPDSKNMSVERFFDYNEPLCQKTTDELNALKCKYDLSKNKESSKVSDNRTNKI